MFQVQKCTFGKFNAYRLVNQANNSYIEVLPSHGGLLNAWVESGQDHSHSLILGYENESHLQAEYTKNYRGAKLFPFPNRVKAGQYTWENNSYQLPINFPKEKLAIHGLVYNQEFQVKELANSNLHASLLIEYTFKGIDSAYPFPFRIKTLYTYQDQQLKIENYVLNTGSEKMPCGLGWHPYFQLGPNVAEYEIQMGTAHKILLDQGLPTGKEVPQEYNDFQKVGSTEYDDCFRVQAEEKPVLKVQNQQENIGLDFYLDSPYQYLQIYSPPSRDSLAIEPMSCPPNALNSQEDLILIPPGESRHFNWEVHFKKN